MSKGLARGVRRTHADYTHEHDADETDDDEPINVALTEKAERVFARPRVAPKPERRSGAAYAREILNMLNERLDEKKGGDAA